MLRKVLLVATGSLALFLVLASSSDADAWRRRRAATVTERGLAPPAALARGLAPGARPVGGASAASVPDGAGGTYVAWSSLRDGVGDVRVVRVTATGDVASGWPVDGIAVCTARGHQNSPAVFPDGANGVIIGWFDFRDRAFNLVGGSTDIYAQRVNSAGVPQWTANGVKAVDGFALAADLWGEPDGAGGMFVAWTDGFGGVARVLHFNASGALPAGWDPAGEPVTTLGPPQYYPTAVPDGSGGCYVAWDDGDESHAQRLSSAGDPQWGDGVVVGAGPGATLPVACPGSAGSLLYFWTTTDAVMGQHLDSNGTEQWTTGGETLGSLSVGPAREMWAVPDGAGGALVSWMDEDAPARLSAQHVDGTGAVQWGADGVIVCSAAGDRYVEDLVAEAGGGLTLAWQDSRASTDGYVDLYAQRLNAAGVPQWTADGLAICTALVGETSISLAPDGAGGSLLGWVDYRSLDPEVFAQRVNAAGAPQLLADGKRVVTDPGVQQGALTVPDGAGGMWVLWHEKSASQYDLRARRLNGSGLSIAGPTALCTAAGHQLLADAVSDGGGGVIALWTDARGGGLDLYAQRLDSGGAAQWATNGVAVCSAPQDQFDAHLVADGAGGAIAAWADRRNGPIGIYAQRMNGAGAAQWAANGVAVCALLSGQQSPVIAAAASNGAIVAWMDSRTVFAPAIYAQRLDGAGAAQWAANGVSVLGTGFFGDCAAVVSDGAGGAVVLAEEQVFDLMTLTYLSTQHLAERVNAAGTPQWGGPVTLSNVDGYKSDARMVSDGSGGAIVAWSEGGAGVNDIAAQRVDAAGTLPWGAAPVTVCADASWQHLSIVSPDGVGGAVLAWTDERSGFADVYAQRLSSAGAAQWTADGVAVASAALGQYGAALFTYPSAATLTAWTDHRTGTERLIHAQALSFGGVPQWGGGVTGTLFALAAAEAAPGRVRVTWQTSALTSVRAERRTPASGWTALGTLVPDGQGRVTIEDTDVTAGERYAYRIGLAQAGGTAYAAEVWVQVPGALAFGLEGLRPNPAAGELNAAFTLGVRGPARLELLDVGGRRVAERDLSAFGPGRHLVRLGGVQVPAGLYFLRLTQGEASVTARAAVVR